MSMVYKYYMPMVYKYYMPMVYEKRALTLNPQKGPTSQASNTFNSKPQPQKPN